MTASGTPAQAPARRRSRSHELLLAAFVAGATLEQAAKAAAVSPRTAARWKAVQENRAELDAARADLVEAAIASVREALPAAAQGMATAVRALGASVPAAAQRLSALVESKKTDPGVAIRASAELLAAVHRFHSLSFEVFGRLAEHSSLAARLDALEAAVAARAAAEQGRPWRPTILGGSNTGA